jgi:ParB-like chromosome segregation protein Spo0J
MSDGEGKRIPTGFEREILELKLAQLLPTRQLKDAYRQSAKYKALVGSIEEVGLIEPLVVYPQQGDQYLLLDGNVRYYALKQLGIAQAQCLVSTDDESYTYNTKVNRVSPIQAYRMIKKALDAGVPEERIAKALNWSPKTIGQTRSVLSNLCPEAIEVLKDKDVPLLALRLLKRVKPLRQIEIAELMRSTGNYSAPYARMLVLMSGKDQFVEYNNRRKRMEPVRPEDLAKMENELKALERDFQLLDETYARNVMDLTLAKTYLKKLLDNGKVVRFIAQKYPDVLSELQKIVEATSLES